MNNMAKDIIKGVVYAASIFGVGYGIGSIKKVKSIEDRMDEKVDSLLEGKEVDICQCAVDDAIERHIEKRIANVLDTNIRSTCERTARDVEHKIYNTIQAKAEDVVTDTYKEMSAEAKRAIEKDIRNIDTSSLRTQIITEAKDEVSQKLAGAMDDILKEFNGKLNSVATIYESIEKSITNR